MKAPKLTPTYKKASLGFVKPKKLITKMPLKPKKTMPLRKVIKMKPYPTKGNKSVSKNK